MTRRTDLPPIDAEHGLYRERAILPQRAALLSIDMQNQECAKAVREAGATDPRKAAYFGRLERVVIPNQRRLQASARAHGIEVIYTTIESLTEDGRDRSLDHKISRILVPKGSWDAKVIDEVAPVGDEIVIPKTASGVFNATNIEYVLRNLGVEYLIVYGVLTDQCVESTVRDAADRGFLVTQIEDCCATYSGAHERSIEAMRGHYCRTRTTGEMIAEIESLARRRRAAG